jgi:predicted transcriptional regulator
MKRGEPARAPRRAAGALENEVLATLWAADEPLTPTQIQAAVGDVAYNTVHTILTRLLDKGSVVRELHHSRPAYAPAKDAAQTVADQMHAALEAGSDRDTILARFVSNLSHDDEVALRALLAGPDGQTAAVHRPG